MDDEPRKVGRPSNEARMKEVHERALERFDQAFSAQQEVRSQCIEARRFYSVPGGQWAGAVGEQFANKARFELNKVHLSVIRVFNEYRNNRITVDFTAKDGQKDDLADTCDGLYRADEKACTADEAYDNAFEEGVGGGMGAWRVRACYEDEHDDDNDQQRVRIEPIVDADSSVYWDNNSKRYDKGDAKWCFVVTALTPAAFKEEYEHDPTSWDKGALGVSFDWFTKDSAYVAQYYEVEEKEEKVHIFASLLGDEAPEMSIPDSEMDDDKLQQLLATGFRLVRQKRVTRCKVHKYILSGMGVEEDEGIIAGSCIPVVTFYAKRWFIDGVERCMGHVHLAMDAQRLINMLMSWLAEMAAKFDREKPILAPDQVAKHAWMWADDAVKQFPYLLLEPTMMADGTLAVPPLQYTKAPTVPPAMAALLELAEQSLQDLLGNQQAGEEIKPNISGKAVELIQNRLDMQVFIYMSNLAKSMKRCGEIWLSMMRDIVVEESRRMKTVAADGSPGSVVMNEPYVDESGRQTTRNDMSKASFDVDVDVGPSSSSKRTATVRAITGMMSITQDPQMLQALSIAAITNMDGEGLQDLRDWARAQGIRMGVIKPTEEEQKQLAAEAQNQQPDPQAQYLQAEALKSAKEAQLADAKTIDTLAAADLKQAQTAKTESEVGVAREAQRNDVLKHASGMQADMAKHEDAKVQHAEDRDHQAKMAKQAPKTKA